MLKLSGTLVAGAALFLLQFSNLASAQNGDGSEQTFLDEYVFSEESMSQFSYFHASEYDFEGTNPITHESYKAYIINMTSGQWLSGK